MTPISLASCLWYFWTIAALLICSLRLPASEDYINEQIRRAAIVQKYQRQLANEMGVTEASLNWDGYEYSKILKKHSVRNHKKVLDRLRVSELTIHHDTFNIINGLGKKN